jgi:uncharacterized protein
LGACRRAADGRRCGAATSPTIPRTTGMLSAIVAPLADGGMPVMVASTFHADLVLVPAERLDDAVSALRAARHRVSR